jgi:hypothetical protein
MIGPVPLAEYGRQIRSCVCSLCVERLPGAPPCMELGKVCGIETHMPELIGAVHQAYGGLMDPYVDAVKCLVCEGCASRGSFDCPCPMDYLLPLIVEAVEAVDDRHVADPNDMAGPSIRPGEGS